MSLFSCSLIYWACTRSKSICENHENQITTHTGAWRWATAGAETHTKRAGGGNGWRLDREWNYNGFVIRLATKCKCARAHLIAWIQNWHTWMGLYYICDARAGRNNNAIQTVSVIPSDSPMKRQSEMQTIASLTEIDSEIIVRVRLTNVYSNESAVRGARCDRMYDISIFMNESTGGLCG